MADVATNPSKPEKNLDALRKTTKYAGTYVGGVVVAKQHKPASVAKDGKPIEEKWVVSVSWFGGSADCKCSNAYHDQLSLMQDVMLPVTLTTYGGDVFYTITEV